MTKARPFDSEEEYRTEFGAITKKQMVEEIDRLDAGKAYRLLEERWLIDHDSLPSWTR